MEAMMLRKLVLLMFCAVLPIHNFCMDSTPVIDAALLGGTGFGLNYALNVGLKNFDPKEMLFFTAFGAVIGVVMDAGVCRVSSLYKKWLTKTFNSRPNVEKKITIDSVAYAAGLATVYSPIFGRILALASAVHPPLALKFPITLKTSMGVVLMMLPLGAALGSYKATESLRKITELIERYDYITALRLACIHNDLDQIEYCIALGAPVNDKCSIGETALHTAALWGRKEIVAYLIEQGADLKARTHNGETFMHYAAGNGHNNIVKFLIGEYFFPPAFPTSQLGAPRFCFPTLRLAVPKSVQSLKAQCLMAILKHPDTYKNLSNDLQRLGNWSLGLLAEHGSLKFQREVAQTLQQCNNYERLTSFLTAHGNRHLMHIQNLIAMRKRSQKTARDEAQLCNHQDTVRLLDQISRANNMSELDPTLKELMIENFKTKLAIN